jgi:nitrate reductase gamma subunit
MPVHLRWELYPVAHEKDKPYGGSYLEEVDWWHRPRRINPLGEFQVFLREILLFREYYNSNRGYWYFVYPFHIGLFLLIAWIVLLVVEAVLDLNGLAVHALALNPWLKALYYVTLVTGLAAFALGLIGTAGLLVKRMLDEDLRVYTDPIDYFNLAWLLLLFLSGLLSCLLEDGSFAALGLVQGLITFKPFETGPLLTTFILLSALFLAYMPFTRMMHYVAKYFTYHKVRWDDEPNTKGGKLEGKVRELLAQPESWSAPHIQQGKSWSEQTAGTGSPDNREAPK